MVLLPGCPCCKETECCCEDPKKSIVAGAVDVGAYEDWCWGLLFYSSTRYFSTVSTISGDFCVVSHTIVMDEKSGADVIVATMKFSYPICSGGSEVGDKVRLEISGTWNAVYEKTLTSCPTVANGVAYAFGPSDVISGSGSYCGGAVTWTVKAGSEFP
jgi:hypothetical protein